MLASWIEPEKVKSRAPGLQNQALVGSSPTSGANNERMQRLEQVACKAIDSRWDSGPLVQFYVGRSQTVRHMPVEHVSSGFDSRRSTQSHLS